MNTKEQIEEILLTDYQYVDCHTVQKLLDLFAVMQRSEQLVCDKCKEDLNTPISVLRYITEMESALSMSGVSDSVYDPNWEIIQTAPHGIQYKNKITGETKWE